MPRYVIIGNSAGGVGAVEAIREVDPSSTLTLISDEPYPAYSRPMISNFLAEEAGLENMLYRGKGFYQEQRVEALLGRRAAKIDFEARTVGLEDGATVEYERLLLAPGGVPIIPRMAGGEKSGVFTFNKLADAEKMKPQVEGAKEAVVIGGGLIGVSVAEALVKRGLEVSVVEMKDRVLNLLLDPQASALIEAAMRREGVEILANHTVAEVLGRGEDGNSVGGVVLDDGQRRRADLAVVAIGVAPRTELVVGSKIKVNRGIVVDRLMETTVPGVFACGDVAEAHDFILETSRLTPIWPNAYYGGRVAGFNMAGRRAEYPGGTAMNALKYFGVPIVSAGLTILEPGREGGFEILASGGVEEGRYRKILLKEGRVVGLTFVGEIEGSGIVYGLMRSRASVEGFKDLLLSPSLGLSILPPELRRERLMGGA